MARDENRLVKDQRPRYDCLLFDLDDTLYPLSSGLAVACTKNIADFVNQKLGIEKNRIPDLCRQLYTTYGTSMAGLRAVGYELDYDDYHSFVHGRLAYANLKPDPVLKNLLLSMPQRKIIFFDDSPRNIAAGKREGLHTVLVGTPVRTEGADFALESIHNIREALPEIWEEDAESSINVRQSTGATAAIETVVTA